MKNTWLNTKAAKWPRAVLLWLVGLLICGSCLAAESVNEYARKVRVAYDVDVAAIALGAAPALSSREMLEHAILGEEVAWLKMAGWDRYHPPAGSYRDLDYYRYLEEPAPRKMFSTLPLPRLATLPKLDGDLSDPIWAKASRGSIKLTVPVKFEEGPLLTVLVSAYRTDSDLALALEADRPLFQMGQAVADIVTTESRFELRMTKTGLGIGKRGGSSVAVPGAATSDGRTLEFTIPLAHFPKGLAAGLTIEPNLQLAYAQVAPVIPDQGGAKPSYWRAWKKVVFQPAGFSVREQSGELRVSFQNHGDQAIELAFTQPRKETLTLAPGERRELTGESVGPVGPELEFRWRQGQSDYALDQLVYQPLPKALAEFEKLINLRESQGQNVEVSKAQLPALRAAAATGDRSALLAIRAAKRALFFDHPALAALAEVLFVKRHPLHPCHNYTEYYSSQAWPGGGIGVWRAPVREGRLQPDAARVEMLFDAGLGFVRTPAADYDAQKIYFSYMPADPELKERLRIPNGFFRIMVMNRDGSNVRQLTDGQWQDVWPTPLPDGGLALISSRQKGRFLCFRPAILTLFRMDADGKNLRVLSPNNLSEWAPAVLSDGRLAWTRSEYQDKGAVWGHTAWAIRPDGTHPELIYGNNTPGGYGDIREVPGTDEYVCTLVNHRGDFNGPLALLRPVLGQASREAVLNITPDVEAVRHDWQPPIMEAFREPYPISRDFILCSHAPLSRFALAVVDRYGHRELLYLDDEFGSMRPTPLRPQPKPPVLPSALDPELAAQGKGTFFVSDVYIGLGDHVARGEAKYLQVFEQVKADLRQLSNGKYQLVYEPHLDWYATPVRKLKVKEWPAYIAKASHGLVPVNPDGSASFEAPAGKMLYLSLLDKNFNELQRMRSVMHLQAGEKRGCIGCHESRALAPRAMPTQAMRQTPHALQTPSWGAIPFAYGERVQPILDRHCVSCHHGEHKAKLDLRGDLDSDAIPTSYKTILESQSVNYFQNNHSTRHTLATPKSFGALHSRLARLLDAGHKNVKLDRDELLALKTWIAMNCPLWGDYRPLAERLAELKVQSDSKAAGDER